MIDTKKKVTIVTGASRGIGKAIALKLAEEGHTLALFGRDEAKLRLVEQEVKELQNNASIYTGDVADEEFVNKAVQSVLDEYGQIDNLINNAGFMVNKKLAEVTLDELKRQINTNLYGVFNFSKAAAKHMTERKSGNIINISSLAGKNGFPGGTTYSATKHAVMGFTKSLMLEIREHNVRVLTINPGSVDTDMLSSNNMAPSKPEKILKPEDIAHVVSSVINVPANANISDVDIRPTNPKY